MKRALVCGAGGFIGGDPENFGLRIADCELGISDCGLPIADLIGGQSRT